MIERLIDAAVITILVAIAGLCILLLAVGWLLIIALVLVYSKWFLLLFILYPIPVAVMQYLWEEGIL